MSPLLHRLLRHHRHHQLSILSDTIFPVHLFDFLFQDLTFLNDTRFTTFMILGHNLRYQTEYFTSRSHNNYLPTYL